LDAGFRREHGLHSGVFQHYAVAVTDRRGLVISLKRRLFTIIESSPRADARVAKYAPKRHHEGSVRDHVVIQAKDTTVEFGVVLSMRDRGAELIAASAALSKRLASLNSQARAQPASKRAATRATVSSAYASLLLRATTSDLVATTTPLDPAGISGVDRSVKHDRVAAIVRSERRSARPSSSSRQDGCPFAQS
jgi:hypothetical protein